MHRYSLKPFPGAGPAPPVTITGDLSRRGPVLAIQYDLRGRLGEVAIPSPAAVPLRKYDLWEATCGELFFGVRGAPNYWEVNLSPAGHWNVFALSGYRQGLTEEGAFQSLPFGVQRQAQRLLLTLELDLGRIIPRDLPLEVGITAVVQDHDGRLTYWALAHPGPEPDFHRRDSFLIRV
jgi:hypothetical protein